MANGGAAYDNKTKKCQNLHFWHIVFWGTLNSATLGLGSLMLMLPSRSFFTVKEDPGKVHGDPGNFAQFSLISFLAAYPGIFVPG